MNPDEALAAGDWPTVLQALSDLQRAGHQVEYGWVLTDLGPGPRVERIDGWDADRFVGWLPARDPGPRRFALDDALELTEDADGAWSWTPPPVWRPQWHDLEGETWPTTTAYYGPTSPVTNGTNLGVEWRSFW